MSATRIRRRLDCALDDRMSHWMASPDWRLKRALIDPEIFEAKVNQARADDLAKPRVPNQQAQVDRAVRLGIAPPPSFSAFWHAVPAFGCAR